jgi:DNA-directed RNA polymerase specialized sigma24 family protein
VQQPTETLPTGLEASQRVSALYQAHALALKRLAFLMTGDQPTAEDVVQDAFLGLCRRWPSLQETGNASTPSSTAAAPTRTARPAA